MIKKETKLRKLLAKLQNALPTPFPVHLTVVHPDVIRGYWGFCIKHEHSFEIQLANDSYGVMYYSFLHEFAHALAWDEGDFHGPEWGIAYAKVWKIHANELD